MDCKFDDQPDKPWCQPLKILSTLKAWLRNLTYDETDLEVKVGGGTAVEIYTLTCCIQRKFTFSMRISKILYAKKYLKG